MSLSIATYYASDWLCHPLTFNCMWTGDALNGSPGLRQALLASFSHEIWPLPSDTCISPGRECQRMSAGLLHMWLAFLSCSLSLPQLPPPAPLWKPRLTEPSLAPSFLSDTRSISCVPRASNWLARQRAFAGTTAPGVAQMPPAKVSITQEFVDQFYSLGVTLETHIHLTQNECFPIFTRYIFHMFIRQRASKKTLEGDETDFPLVVESLGNSTLPPTGGREDAWRVVLSLGQHFYKLLSKTKRRQEKTKLPLFGLLFMKKYC